jgi:putative MATE family efflux protein
MWLAAGLGLASGAFGAAFAGPVVGWFGGAPESAEYAATYLRISAAGIPAMLLILATTGVLRGLQDTRTPLVVLTGGFGLNIALNLLLVFGLDLGIAGSALGTVISQWLMALALGAVIIRGARRRHASMRPDVRGIRGAATAGVALLVRTLTLRAALLAMTYAATQQGDVALAAHQVAFTLWTLLALALDAIAIAGQAITGRYLGAGDAPGARLATRRMLWWGAMSGVALGALLAVARPAYVGLFTTDGDVREALLSVLLVAAVLQPVCGVVFALDGVLIGAGDAPYLAWAGVATLVVFLPLVGWVIAAGGGLVVLWWAFGAFMGARLVTLVLRERSDAWLVTGATARPARTSLS